MNDSKTLEWGHDITDNMVEVARLTLEHIKEVALPTEVQNRHEGYGIAAEACAAMLAKVKITKNNMDDFLKLLPNSDMDILGSISSLYNAALQTSIAAITLAAQSRRILDDLYDKEQKLSPIEELIAEAEEDFEDVTEAVDLEEYAEEDGKEGE